MGWGSRGWRYPLAALDRDLVVSARVAGWPYEEVEQRSRRERERRGRRRADWMGGLGCEKKWLRVNRTAETEGEKVLGGVKVREGSMPPTLTVDRDAAISFRGHERPQQKQQKA